MRSGVLLMGPTPARILLACLAVGLLLLLAVPADLFGARARLSRPGNRAGRVTDHAVVAPHQADTDSVAITVQPFHAPPPITSIADQSIDQDGSTPLWGLSR